MTVQNSKFEKRLRRHRKVRAKIRGTANRPRFSVYRSNRHLFLQLVNDDRGETVLGVSDKSLKIKKEWKKSDIAYECGMLLAKKAVDAGIKIVVFDRGGYRYHGRVRRAAEGAREGGLKF